jgi:hypothetical protein
MTGRSILSLILVGVWVEKFLLKILDLVKKRIYKFLNYKTYIK